MADRITFTIDGKRVKAAPEETIWQVANRLGIEIPHARRAGRQTEPSPRFLTLLVRPHGPL